MDNEKSKRHVARYEPTRFISPLHEMMDRFFGDNFINSSFDFPREMVRGVTFPKVDISESEKEVIVTANVPGINPDDIHIEVDTDSVFISGSIEKEKKEGEEGKIFYRFEREYGEFQREFALPAKVNKDAVSAVTKNGVLMITLPKLEADSKKRVSVKGE